jgi:hypothetical protein
MSQRPFWLQQMEGPPVPRHPASHPPSQQAMNKSLEKGSILPKLREGL